MGRKKKSRKYHARAPKKSMATVTVTIEDDTGENSNSTIVDEESVAKESSTETEITVAHGRLVIEKKYKETFDVVQAHVQAHEPVTQRMALEDILPKILSKDGREHHAATAYMVKYYAENDVDVKDMTHLDIKIWDAMCERFSNLATLSRYRFLKAIPDIFVRHEHFRERITKLFMHIPLRDDSDVIRAEILTAVGQVAKKNHKLMTRDLAYPINYYYNFGSKELKVLALTTAATVYRETRVADTHDARNRFIQFPELILRSLKSCSMEHRLFVLSLIRGSLVPQDLATDERMTALFDLYMFLKEDDVRVLDDIFAEQLTIRHMVGSIVRIFDNCSPNQRKLTQVQREEFYKKSKELSKFFRYKNNFSDVFLKLMNLGLRNKEMLNAMSRLIKDNLGAVEYIESKLDLLKGLSPNKNLSQVELLFPFVEMLVDRCCVFRLDGPRGLFWLAEKTSITLHTYIATKNELALAFSNRAVYLLDIIGKHFPGAFKDKEIEVILQRCLTSTKRFLSEVDAYNRETVSLSELLEYDFEPLSDDVEYLSEDLDLDLMGMANGDHSDLDDMTYGLEGLVTVELATKTRGPIPSAADMEQLVASAEKEILKHVVDTTTNRSISKDAIPKNLIDGSDIVPGKFECKICQEIHYTTNAITRHLAIEHAGEFYSKIQCGLCQQKFFDFVQFIDHVKASEGCGKDELKFTRLPTRLLDMHLKAFVKRWSTELEVGIMDEKVPDGLFDRSLSDIEMLEEEEAKKEDVAGPSDINALIVQAFKMELRAADEDGPVQKKMAENGEQEKKSRKRPGDFEY